MLFINASKLSTPRSFQCHTAQKMKFFIKDFFSKCDQILMKNVSFCAVLFEYDQVPNMARTKLFKTFVSERFGTDSRRT